jgi:hypothetical protein
VLSPLGIKAYQLAKTKGADWEDRFRVEKNELSKQTGRSGERTGKRKNGERGQAGYSTRMAGLAWPAKMINWNSN